MNIAECACYPKQAQLHRGPFQNTNGILHRTGKTTLELVGKQKVRVIVATAADGGPVGQFADT